MIRRNGHRIRGESGNICVYRNYCDNRYVQVCNNTTANLSNTLQSIALQYIPSHRLLAKNFIALLIGGCNYMVLEQSLPEVGVLSEFIRLHFYNKILLF